MTGSDGEMEPSVARGSSEQVLAKESAGSSGFQLARYSLSRGVSVMGVDTPNDSGSSALNAGAIKFVASDTPSYVMYQNDLVVGGRTRW